MGQVYRATDTQLKRQVAIKVLPPSLGTDRDRLGRFQREAERLASLNHPNIGAIYGVEKEGDVYARVLELGEGQTLAQKLTSQRPKAIRLEEALTGRPAFIGETTTDVLAKIVEREPDWTKLPPSTPPRLARLLRRCFAKDPKRRARDIGDVRMELDDETGAPGGSTPIATL